MDSCSKHNKVRCRFYCSTCSVPVCHVCMESGDHLIPEHQCIPLSEYCQKKSIEIRAFLDTATQHKTQYDGIKLKWDRQLSSYEGEFLKLKNEIRLTKLQLQRQLDIAEQLLSKKAWNAKDRKEKAMKFAQVSHDQTFNCFYQQVSVKCRFLLRKLETQNVVNEEAFQECHNLLSKLEKELAQFDKEELLGINFKFLPSSQTCFLGEVIVPEDTDCLQGPDYQSANEGETGKYAQKRKVTDTGIDVIKKEKIDSPMGYYHGNQSSHKGKKTDNSSLSGGNISTAGDVGTSTTAANSHSNVDTRDLSSVTPHPQWEKNDESRPTISSLDVVNTSVSAVTNAGGNKMVDLCCAGIILVDNDWLLEVSTTKSSIKIKHHQISGCGQFRPDNMINCKQNMEYVDLHVCPKVHSPDYSFVVAFNDQIGIISLKGHRGREVTWKTIPTKYPILAISWRKLPTQFLAIVKGSDDRMILMRDISGGSAPSQYDIRTLSNFDLYYSHPLDISLNDEIGICNTISGNVHFFSSVQEITPTKQITAPSFLKEAQPVSLLVKDGKKEWLVLWKGKSSADNLLQWAVVRYNASFDFLSTVMRVSYKKQHEEPMAFTSHGNKLAVLYNSFEVAFHNILTTFS